MKRATCSLFSFGLVLLATACAPEADVYDQCGRWGDYTFLCWPTVIEDVNGYSSCSWDASDVRGRSGTACEDAVFGLAPPQQGPTRDCLECLMDALGTSCQRSVILSAAASCCEGTTYETFQSGWLSAFDGRFVCDGSPYEF